VLPTQTQTLIKLICDLREVDGGKGKGKEMEDDLIKWMIKLGVEHSAKKISYKEFRPADVPMREGRFVLDFNPSILTLGFFRFNNPNQTGFEVLCNLYEKTYGRERKPEDLRPLFEKVEHLFEQSEVCSFFSPTLSQLKFTHTKPL